VVSACKLIIFTVGPMGNGRRKVVIWSVQNFYISRFLPLINLLAIR